MISDIRNFTSLTESLTPEMTVTILNRHFSQMIDVVQKYGGIIVDFFGDGILVFFDPFEGPIAHTILRTLRCALEMQKAMEPLSSQTSPDGAPDFQVGIGLNAGELVVGNIGSESWAKHGIVGAAVNTTQRIEKMAMGGQVVISDTICNRVQESLRIETSFRTRLKGFQQEMTLHVVKDLREEPFDKLV